MNKILVVDDDEDILVLVKTVLTMNNYMVEAISNWEYIDECISRFAPKLILLDISLTGADGRDICRRIKEDEKNNHMPILLFSANGELGKTYASFNAQGFVEKPFELPHLLKTIKHQLEVFRVR